MTLKASRVKVQARDFMSQATQRMIQASLRNI
jgi:hypothetical protein